MAKIYLKLVLTMSFWGATFVAGRMLAGHVAPVNAAFLRFATAAVILLVVVRRRNGRLPAVPRRSLLPIAGLSLTGVFSYNVLFFWGLESVPAGRAAVIIANNPVFIALFAGLLFRERLGWIKSLGIPISVTGAVVVISEGHPSVLWSGGLGWGDLMIFGCVVSWVAFSLLGKVVVARVPPLTAICYASTLGAVLLFVPAALNGMLGSLGDYRLLDWGNIVFLGVFGTAFGFVWYYEGIERIGATRAGLFINLVPINAVCMGFVFLGEPVSPSLLVGAALVLCGVYLTNHGLPHIRPPAAVPGPGA